MHHQPGTQGTALPANIAQAWANGPLSLALSTDEENAKAERFHNSKESAGNQDLLDPSDDSVLDWMMVAVSAGANHDG